MKLLVIFSLFFLPVISNAENVYQDVVLGEIQKTLINDYGTSDEFWTGGTNAQVKKPVKIIQPKKVVSKKKPVQVEKKEPIAKRKVSKPLIDDDVIDEEGDGYAKYKKREKRGLIDDGEYVPYVDPNKTRKRKKYVKKTIAKKTKAKVSKNDWMSKKMNQQSIWDNSKKADLNKWEKAKKDMLNRWQVDRKKYFKRLPTYKRNLVSTDVFSSSGNFEANNEKLKTKFKGSGVVIIPNAFDLKIKDQGKRPTCSAFASTRALEISLAQGGTKKRLSDQFIYYASKPYCQKSPCSKRGSWALTAFKRSQNSSSPDIPSEKLCPYSKSPKSGNETQIPLTRGCFKGEHQLKKFNQVKSLTQIIRALDKGQPVVSGFKLSPNFYRNKGVILQKDAAKSGSMNSHSAGHAILLVGYMKIPPSLNEGKVCFITANSWGEGWGKGGHACISEKWVKNYRFNISFLAVEKVI